MARMVSKVIARSPGGSFARVRLTLTGRKRFPAIPPPTSVRLSVPPRNGRPPRHLILSPESFLLDSPVPLTLQLTEQPDIDQLIAGPPDAARVASLASGQHPKILPRYVLVTLFPSFQPMHAAMASNPHYSAMPLPLGRTVHPARQQNTASGPR